MLNRGAFGIYETLNLGRRGFYYYYYYIFLYLIWKNFTHFTIRPVDHPYVVWLVNATLMSFPFNLIVFSLKAIFSPNLSILCHQECIEKSIYSFDLIIFLLNHLPFDRFLLKQQRYWLHLQLNFFLQTPFHCLKLIGFRFLLHYPKSSLHQLYYPLFSC